MDTNFRARYEERLSELTESGDDDALVEYMIACMPYIKRYNGHEDDSSPQKKVSNAFTDVCQRTSGIKKNDIFNEYLETVENVYSTQKGGKLSTYGKPDPAVITCYGCGGYNIHVDSPSSQEVCRDCGKCREHLGAELTYKEEQEHVDRNVNYSYKRSNHFQEWLNQLQAAESTTIPPEVVDSLRAEFKKEKIKDLKTITHAKVRSHLKKLKLNRFYEHVPYITNILSGKPPMQMSQPLQERLKNMFNEIQEPFDKHCPQGRKNFLSYSYVLYKFCELLSEDEYLMYFPLLKSREKLAIQDTIWKNICSELRWEFIPTV